MNTTHRNTHTVNRVLYQQVVYSSLGGLQSIWHSSFSTNATLKRRSGSLQLYSFLNPKSREQADFASIINSRCLFYAAYEGIKKISFTLPTYVNHQKTSPRSVLTSEGRVRCGGGVWSQPVSRIGTDNTLHYVLGPLTICMYCAFTDTVSTRHLVLLRTRLAPILVGLFDHGQPTCFQPAK